MKTRTKTVDTRHITLARSIGERLFVNAEGRIFVVGGQPEYKKLASGLAGCDRPPRAAEAPSPLDLGLSTCDGELTPDLLFDVGRALHRWGKELACEASCRPAKRRKANDVARDLREVQHLQERLALLRQWRSELASGNEPSGAPLFLDSTAETELDRILRTSQACFATSPLIAWQARVVYWLSGKTTAERYLATLQRWFGSSSDFAFREQIRDFQRMLWMWKRRSEQEPVRYLKQEMKTCIQRLHPNVASQGRFSARVNGNFTAHCKALIQRCDQLLGQAKDLRWQQVPAALAALVAADGSHVAIPQRCFVLGLEKENYKLTLGTIGSLAEQIGQPGYSQLLAAIDQLPHLPREHDYPLLCQILGAGHSITDAAWLCEHDLLHYLPDSCLDVTSARELAEKFTRSGWQLSNYDLCRLLGKLRTPEQRVSIESWLQWLGSVSLRSITPRLLKAIQSAFWDVYFPSIQRPGWFEHFQPGLEPLHSSCRGDRTGALLTRIVACQQLVGKRAELPKSLRSLVQWQERRQREREHLRAQQAMGTLPDSAAARLRNLESTNEQVSPGNHAKLVRTSEEVFLILGLEAQRATAQRQAEAKCRQHLGQLTELFDREQLWGLAGWVDEMNAAEQKRLCQLIAAQASHDQDYKRHLPENLAWIEKTQRRGVDLTSWFNPACEEVMIGGQAMEIVVASDLEHLFRMGSYFGTCLSLGQVNQLSVLTNAYDANKQVVFLFARDNQNRRQVIARQIIAISSEFKLLGYCCYLRWPQAEKAQRRSGFDAMARYCGRLAASCGLELADEGTPEQLGDHFWYDDGTRPWAEVARQRDRQPAQAC